jgi:4-oxalocrotonate tautomerase
VNVGLGEGVFSNEQKRDMIARITDSMVSVAGEALRPVTWVLIEEVTSGEWGIAGKGLSTSDVRALQRAGVSS